MGIVLDRRNPFKVVPPVVLLLPVFMITLVNRRRLGSMERIKHKPLNNPRESFSSSSKADPKVSLFIWNWMKDAKRIASESVVGSHAAKIGNVVKSLHAHNWLPDFFGHALRITVYTHVVNLNFKMAVSQSRQALDYYRGALLARLAQFAL